MGWFPARDKNNLVPPENLNWPQKPSVTVDIIKGKRSHQTMRGTKKHPLPSVGSPGGCKRKGKTIYRILSENAITMGWCNGKKIR